MAGSRSQSMKGRLSSGGDCRSPIVDHGSVLSLVVRGITEHPIEKC